MSVTVEEPCNNTPKFTISNSSNNNNNNEKKQQTTTTTTMTNNKNNQDSYNNNNSTTDKEAASLDDQQSSVLKQRSDDLKSRYTSTKRRQEIISVLLFFVFLAISIQKMFNVFYAQNIWLFLSASVLAMVAADFFSGIVHCEYRQTRAADTWGSLDTPLVGNSFIRSFREHHVAPTAMTKHDFIETNGDNCMLTVPVLAFTAFGPIIGDSTYNLFLLSFLVKLSFWVMLTNQIHKWSHTYDLPSYVKFMQRYGIILSKPDHAVHHRNPFDKYYCITNGWLNPWLAGIGFWKRLEEIITLTTGAIPRKDDQAWTN
ncbi:hypothetical protein DFA_02722 [Cavenderia fasciculata]|uniref:Lipid desaturase domain-containing protein n=1 Tax=Cavenderia fasciculata TaxID=261658 RepID=F4PHZ2_CACFS|nr:uncharacterized protein DFA_02722 [Cavenderia fasciculata]EGG24479.1 hypothetical protein DFA_02722 [Cavenderia fasciculata]|eukprot:XP_004362330.1 hypothetical protein DFA_02722 [Cavenderia fasciculata]